MSDDTFIEEVRAALPPGPANVRAYRFGGAVRVASEPEDWSFDVTSRGEIVRVSTAKDERGRRLFSECWEAIATRLGLRDDRDDLESLAAEAPSGEAILRECRSIARTLLTKNIQYGNSALEPVRVFSQASPREQILVRLDDKLSRIAKGKHETEDVILDLIGYLVLLRVSDEC